MPILIRPGQQRRRPVAVPSTQRQPAVSSVVIHGMHGMGDNLHQRAIVRQLLERYDVVYLETPWPCIYHDLRGPRLRLIRKPTTLRTQAKNEERERQSYDVSMAPRN